MSIPTRADLLEAMEDAQHRADVAEEREREIDRQLEDALVVLARHGVNIERGQLPALIECAIRDARRVDVAPGCVTVTP